MGDPNGIRTRVTAVKGKCMRLANYTAEKVFNFARLLGQPGQVAQAGWFCDRPGPGTTELSGHQDIFFKPPA
jgi:hypothetical protein